MGPLGTASGSSSQAVRRTRSTDATARASTTTFAVDDQITSIPVLGNTTYIGEVFLIYTVGAGGLKCRVALPSLIGPNLTSAGKYGMHVFFGASFATPISGDSTNNVLNFLADSSAATNGIYMGRFIFRTGASAGNADFQWAQNASSAANSQILANSYFELTPK